MKKTALTFVVLVVAVMTIFGSGNSNEEVMLTSVKGQVIDESTGEALAGVQVMIEEVGKTAFTDFDGVFVIEEIAPGNYDIQTSYISYQPNTLKNANISSSKNSIKVELKTLSSR